MSPPPRLALRGITKSFPGVRANDHVDLTLSAGEIHALLGENGAGKSTLVKILYGVLRADEGEILWHGEPADITSPAVARKLGIAMVFQHFSLFETLTVAENIWLGLDKSEPLETLSEKVRETSTRYGLPLDPGRYVHELSVGERQRIEIVRCLLQSPEMLVMDEPTSVLTPQETERLFETLRRLAAEGMTILYISHKLDEIRVLCDRATILRGGKKVAEASPKEETARSLAKLMIGQDFAEARRQGAVSASADIRLRCKSLTLPPATPFGTHLRDVSFSIRSGEILGMAGVAGNGQAELISALIGELPVPPGMLMMDGVDIGINGAAQRRRDGLAVAPEERNGRGAVPEMSLADNTLLTGYGRFGLVSRGMVKAREAAEKAADIISRYSVKATGPQAQARGLSGGNLQKFIIGREISQGPRVFIASAPTWGVDAGAAAAIHQAILDLAMRGAAVLIISQDLDELLVMSDRICAICAGRVSPAIPSAEATTERVGLMMGGSFGDAGETLDHVA
jgi:general nucleoside transport system ATP-binding protein